jgi:CubicO group peptidase (beta-lactamase class C family)
LKDTKIPEEVTVYHLLTHTSGIGDYFDETNSEEGEWEKLWQEKPIYNMRNLSDYYSMFSEKKPVSSPGGQFCYNGAGYILLGMMIEKASGLSYFDYIRKYVFEKFDMKDSDFFSLDVVSENTAEGYEPVEDKDGNITGWRKNIYSTTPDAASDGGSSSSANDLVKFINGLKGAKELSLVENMLSPQVLIGGPNGPNKIYVHYGFGCFIYFDKNNNIIRWGHTGEEAGISCRMFYYPALDIDVIILGNQGGCAGPLFMAINDILYEEMQK